MVGPSKKRSSSRGSKANASAAARLDTYHQKRHFERTPEPDGKAPAPARGGERQFVVQAHAARNLHYDFRLELDGVLLSWSVPKGPSLKAGLRRLAVRTEDHPLDYASFEGVIPKGEYGGGTVIVWDRGTWTPEGDANKTFAAGRLRFELHGEKLRGRFHLVRTRMDAGTKHENWLLFKGNDEAASDTVDIVRERDESVISGHTLAEVEKLPGRVWHSNRTEHAAEPEPKAAPAKRARKPAATNPAATKTAKKSDHASDAVPTDTVALLKRLAFPFPLTNLDKVLYPEQKLRKAEIIAYYVSVASRMLPHVKGRPLTLVRCPNGYASKCFYQKHASDSVPAVVERFAIAEDDSERELYMAVQDLNGLVALAQMGVLEIHTWGCHTAHVEQPDKLVFDLDPDTSVTWDAVVEAALELRQRLGELDLESFVQTTGGKGLHVVAPLHRRMTWEQHKDFAFGMAELMAKQQPKRYLTSMRKADRKGRIFLDYLRNGRGATAVAPYSTRARTGATVAAPITWDELEAGAKPADFDVHTMIERLGRPDPWQGYAKLEQSISAGARRGVKSR